jgi:hypothetical protein
MSEPTRGTFTMENPDSLKDDRTPLRSIQMDRLHLALIWQKLVKSNEVIKRAHAAVSESIALMKRMGGERG